MFLFIKATDNPDFCKNCHFMKPYYENWAGSFHNTVPCYKCHYGPGFKEYITGKFRLLGEILKYFVGVYSRELKTVVNDAVCIECHPTKDFMDKNIVFSESKINFTHASHLDKNIKEHNFRCQNCHSELVQGRHTAVSLKVCILCHFIGERAELRGECGMCHGPPEEELLLWGVPFKHSEYIEAGVECRTCHLDVTRGRGDVKLDKCGECHVEAYMVEMSYKEIHRIHVYKNNINCFKCHEEIDHGKFLVFKAFSPPCQECHGNTHFIQERVYSGTGGKGVPSLPDRMFLAGVICQGCHRIEKKETTLGPHFELPKADPSTCVFCHGKNFDKLLYKWQNLVKERLEDLKKIEKINNIFKKYGILKYNEEFVKYNLSIVEKDGSFGVHNIKYINLILDEVEKKLRKNRNKPDIEYIYSRNSRCISCHFGIENKNNPYNGKIFEHAPHLFKYKCISCHIESTPDKVIHGDLKIKDCNSCHHKKIDNCEECHKIQADFYKGKFIYDSPDFMYEAEVSCEDCHLKDNRVVRPSSEICSECHEKEYEEDFAVNLRNMKENMKKLDNNLLSILSKLERKKDRKAISDFYTIYKNFENLKKEGSYGAHNLMFLEEFGEKIKKYIIMYD